MQLFRCCQNLARLSFGTDSQHYIVERSVADLTMTTERADGVESALCRTGSRRCHMLFELRLAVLCHASLHTSRFLLLSMARVEESEICILGFQGLSICVLLVVAAQRCFVSSDS